jgi:hypothetical protein
MNGLRPGLRKIHLVARDRFGRAGRGSIRLQIRAVRPRFLILRYPQRLKPGARHITLQVSTNVPAVLRVRGTRRNVDRKPRPIHVRVQRGLRPLRLALFLRAGELQRVVLVKIRR